MPASDDRKGAPPPVPGSGTTLVPPAVGRILGGRYEARGVLGRGGMGEVWLARDVKLQVDVALKVVRPERLGDEGALERLRSEVRSARAVASPHVCRVYDLVEAESLECVSMEYVDGTTLRQLLDARSPLTLAEAREIALQLLAGLAAIHEAGLVHRDVKPENVMRTRAGRVVLMDFGIAKAAASGGTVAGSPAYWAPEQAAGAPADPRADVFATGIVLAEMVAPGGTRDVETRRALWQGLREDPPRVPDTPWSDAIRRAVATNPAERYPSAQALARALEEIAHRVTGVEDAQPYPGLAAFTEAEAEYFFGREAEVEEVWKKLPGRHLLAVVGPSGAGKSSFLRAGLIPAKPEGWAHLICTPGDAPFVALGQALVPEVSRDTHAMRQMLRFEDADVAVGLFRRWRGDHTEALVIVDQLEELFTLNPPDVQTRFASLLSRLVLDADVHVLLSIRDDFLLRCQAHEALRPIFEGLVPLGPPTGDALRRALVQPALKCGYTFEDESLVGEMLQAVEGERGALPLLAFAAASLWERRDRTQGLLTRNSYEAIGGVAGALAQHAEATLEKVGADKLPLVRELFRNLVTAEGTRAVRDVDELLTVFPESQRANAEQVLKTLIDARLLTSYEAHAVEPGQTAGRRVEVVHESLLSAWPRLVRWRTEDEGSAQLRDQLRQAAHLWEEKGKPDDLLWTGTSYQEYQVWRSRYLGGLSELEEDFTRSMADKARRRMRLWTAAAATVIVALAGIAIAIGISRSQTARARDRAEAEALRAEAGKLLALGRAEIDRYPTAALAYARRSLDLADTPEARRFAVETLWRGPVARILPLIGSGLGKPNSATLFNDIKLSPDGKWLAAVPASKGQILVFPRDGGAPRALTRPPDTNVRGVAFGPQSDLLVTGGSGTSLRLWSLPDLREGLSVELGGVGSSVGVRGGTLFTFTRTSKGDRDRLVRAWSLPEGTAQVLGRVDFTGLSTWDFDGTFTWQAFGRGRTVGVRPLDASHPAREQILGSHGEEVEDITCFPEGDRLASVDRSGEIRLWSVAAGARAPLRILQGPRVMETFLRISPGGSHLARGVTESSAYLWELGGPPGAEPVILKRPDPLWLAPAVFDPLGQWLLAGNGFTIAFWPLSNPWVRVLHGGGNSIWSMSFTADGRWLASCAVGTAVRLWPLAAADGNARTLDAKEPCWGLAADPAGAHVLLGTTSGKALLVPTAGGAPRQLPGQWAGGIGIWAVAFDARGRRAVAGPADLYGRLKDPSLRVLRIWDLDSGHERVVSVAHLTDASWEGPEAVRFAPDGSLLFAGLGGVRRLVLAADPSGTATSETVYATGRGRFDLSHDGRYLLAWGNKNAGEPHFDELFLFDLAKHTSHRITSHGSRLFIGTFDPSGRIIVTGDIDGVVRVGPATGEEPHLLLGHIGQITALAVSPDGRWIASATDQAIHLWPMPDVTKPPLHTLPHAELLAKLDDLTNLGVVADPTSSTGWKVEIGPFPGWAKVPTWQP